LDLTHFVLNIFASLLMGVAIGLERQYRQHPAGLRTNALVCVGAALFVSLSRLVSPESSPTRIAAQVVSGIGFLGGGVILREGMTVRGMNTAATVWCSAAVGSLSGAGFPLHGLIGTVTILALHLSLRPISHWIDSHSKTAVHVETVYEFRVVCKVSDEGIIRTILLRHVSSNPRMTIQRISTEDADRSDQATVIAHIFSMERNDRAMEDLMSRINIEPSVTSVRWEKSQDRET